jgi:CHAT domain-containing protein
MCKLQKTRKAAQARLLVMDAVSLPATRREVDGLRSVSGAGNVKIYAGAEADEDRLKQEASHYQMVHLAAHGVFQDSNPMNSSLVQARAGKPEAGMLEARDMMDLNPDADIVVLSGCETGRGIAGGEGLMGLSWALFIAGSPATVASQWKVESGSTSDLMLGFHKNLQTASKARALQQAALEVMKHPSTATRSIGPA